MELILFSIGLGLAGLDIFGVFVIMAALSMGASRKSIISFAITVFTATIIVGVSLSFALGNNVSRISELIIGLPDSTWVVINSSTAILLLWWAGSRSFMNHRKNTLSKDKPLFKKWIKRGLFITGVIFAISALTDPSFLALIAVAGHNGNVATVVIANTFWILISQAMLFIFTTTIVLNKHKLWMKWFTAFQDKHRKTFSIGLTFVITVSGITILVDTLSFLFTGQWLLK